MLFFFVRFFFFGISYRRRHSLAPSPHHHYRSVQQSCRFFADNPSLLAPSPRMVGHYATPVEIEEEEKKEKMRARSRLNWKRIS